MQLFVIDLCFILFDCVSGILTAVKKKKLNSTKMRSGFFNKSAYILVLVLATLCDYSMQFIDIGFNINLFNVASTYIITTEIVSIIENIGNLNSKLLPNKLKEIFLKLGDNEK